MTELRVLNRVVTYDPVTHSILLVRNRDTEWWCAPGGGWNHDRETMRECAEREVLEETGIRVRVSRLLYVQTLRLKETGAVWLEHFWLAEPVDRTEIVPGHVDLHGVVDEARWFGQQDIQTVTAYPEVLKWSFWELITRIYKEDDRYLGHFIT